MKKIAILNGPNLDRLGKREPQIYGTTSLKDLEKMLRAEARKLGVKLDCFQSNHEGELIDKIGQLADRKFDGIVINPGGYAHTSIALRDAISGSCIPTIEVHISDIRKREKFRHHSMTAGACMSQICGKGLTGYVEAMRRLARRKDPEQPAP
ncbi:MAG: type II 3-dehydroquinate dehydratase [Opitutaceae bacterium]|nr:type II 3-dehydroquinate dehydratase [Opitutaceae bacterium]